MEAYYTPEAYTQTAGNYCVAFLDILGQQKALLDLNDKWFSDSSDEEIISQLKLTHGQANQLHTFCKGFFDPFEDIEDENIKICQLHISDSTMIYFKFSGNEFMDMFRLYAFILGIRFIFIDCIANGIQLRGGIERGITIKSLSGVGIYGGALAAAVQLEKEASSQRVILGKHIRDYILSLTAHLQFIKFIKNDLLNSQMDEINISPIFHNNHESEKQLEALSLARCNASRYLNNNGILLKYVALIETIEKVISTHKDVK